MRTAMPLPIHNQTVPSLVVFLVYPGFQPVDLAGPLQAFATAAEEGGVHYDLRIVSAAGGPVKGAGPFEISTEPYAALADRVDTLIVPGGPGVDDASKDALVVQAVKTLAADARRVCAVCTGAFLLASTGLLNGRSACTHWRAAERLASAYPEVNVDPQPIYLRDGRVYTSAGVTAGIDLTLALIEEDAGRVCAHAVARRLVVHMRRPGGQAQYSDALRFQDVEAQPFAPLLAEMAARPAAPWRIADMAEASNHSVRSFYRKFVEATGEGPASALERIRVEYAGALLGSTSASLKEVARRSGFVSEQGMRRAFLRTTGRLPSSLLRPDAAG